MDLSIGKNIAALRRDGGYTQEQLAGFAGVSVAAVSKWETSQSCPDIALLPVIADFFEVSIDALLGHSVTAGAARLEAIKESYRDAKSKCDYNAALPVVLDALRKYPNDAELIEDAAEFLAARAWDSPAAEQDRRDAVQYYERAICCTEDREKRFWLKRAIAHVYVDLDEFDMAIEKFCEINESHAFDWDIAWINRRRGNNKEALRMFQSQLWRNALDLAKTLYQLTRCFRDEGDLKTALEAAQFKALVMERFTSGTAVSYADGLCAGDYYEIADFCAKTGDIAGMWEALEIAADYAVKYDAAPSFDFEAVDLLKGSGVRMSNSSPTLACHGLLGRIQNAFAEMGKDPRYAAVVADEAMVSKYNALCARLEEAKRTKVEAGVWDFQA